MPKKGHTEEQIITALKQHESGEKTTEICRKLAISQPRSICRRSNMRDWAYKSCGRALVQGRANWNALSTRPHCPNERLYNVRHRLHRFLKEHLSFASYAAGKFLLVHR